MNYSERAKSLIQIVSQVNKGLFPLEEIIQCRKIIPFHMPKEYDGRVLTNEDKIFIKNNFIKGLEEFQKNI